MGFSVRITIKLFDVECNLNLRKCSTSSKTGFFFLVVLVLLHKPAVDSSTWTFLISQISIFFGALKVVLALKCHFVLGSTPLSQKCRSLAF